MPCAIATKYKGSISQIRRLAHDLDYEIATTAATDNLAPIDSVYPDKDAPIIVGTAGGLELRMARWGFPPIPGQKDPITNVRNLQSKWWRDVNREWIMAPDIGAWFRSPHLRSQSDIQLGSLCRA